MDIDELSEAVAMQLCGPEPNRSGAAVNAVIAAKRLIGPEIAERDAEIERLRKDAERYRWLRKQDTYYGIDVGPQHRPEELDDEVDEDMANGL